MRIISLISIHAIFRHPNPSWLMVRLVGNTYNFTLLKERTRNHLLSIEQTSIKDRPFTLDLKYAWNNLVNPLLITAKSTLQIVSRNPQATHSFWEKGQQDFSALWRVSRSTAPDCTVVSVMRQRIHKFKYINHWIMKDAAEAILRKLSEISMSIVVFFRLGVSTWCRPRSYPEDLCPRHTWLWLCYVLKSFSPLTDGLWSSRVIMARINCSFSCQHFRSHAALFFSGFVLANAASIMSNGNLVTLDDVNYYTGSPSVSKIVSVGFNSNCSNADVLPITIIRTDETMLTGDILRDVISNYSSSDDVFQPGFLNSESWSSLHSLK